jgi:ATP-binding cassette subfamily F protein 3
MQSHNIGIGENARFPALAPHGKRRAMLHINDLVYRVGGRTLFDGATVAVPEGHKVGLVGRNGSGKSTLFRLILGELHPESGGIAVRRRARVGHLAQEAPDGPRGLLETVLEADGERNALLVEAETATDPHRIAEIHTRLADIDAHSAEARAAAILAGLGFDAAAQARPCGDFSGGWRMRVGLAAVLFARPDLLLLDEPTNHLDLEATLWLESHLAAWPGTLIVISHERRLLNTVVDEIVHLENGKLVRYAGGYDRFERTRAERLTQESRARTRQIDEMRRIRAFVDRFRAKATKARQAQSRLKMLERMEPVAAVVEEPAYAFRFPSPARLAPPLIVLEDAAAGYGGERPVLQGLSLRIDGDDRIGLLGANGNGKTTLLRLLGGRLPAAAGRIRRSAKLKVGYFAQHQIEEMEPGATPYDHMARLMPEAPEAKVRTHLGAFGFAQARADTKIADLSGGEKARLLFALATREAPHLLLLDEPTNHLDVDAREALVQALNEYEGAVILVSHDPHLLELACDRLWLVADGTCTPYDGDLEDYRRLLLESRREVRREARDNGSRPNRREQRRVAAEERARTAPLRAAARTAEARLHDLHAEKTRLESELAEPALYDGPTEKVTTLQIRLAQTMTALAEAETAWLAAHEALEEAENGGT